MIPRDKIEHLLLGFTVATLFQYNCWAMIIVTLVLAIGKEVYDKMDWREFDIADMSCTIGGGFGAIIWRICYNGVERIHFVNNL